MRAGFFIFAIAVLALTLVGCPALNWVTGVEERQTPDGKVEFVDKPGPSPLETAGGLLTPFIPWAGTALGTLGSVILALRKRQWKSAAVSTFDGIETFLKTEEGQAFEKKAKEWLANYHSTKGVYDFVKTVVEKYDH